MKRIVELKDVADLAVAICNLPPDKSLGDFVAAFDVAFELCIQYAAKMDEADLMKRKNALKSSSGEDVLVTLFKNSYGSARHQQ